MEPVVLGLLAAAWLLLAGFIVKRVSARWNSPLPLPAFALLLVFFGVSLLSFLAGEERAARGLFGVLALSLAIMAAWLARTRWREPDAFLWPLIAVTQGLVGVTQLLNALD